MSRKREWEKWERTSKVRCFQQFWLSLVSAVYGAKGFDTGGQSYRVLNRLVDERQVRFEQQRSLHAVAAATRTVDVDVRIVLQVGEGPAEIAAAPIRLLRDLRSYLLR